MPPSTRRSIIVLIGLIAIGVIASIRNSPKQLDGAWRTSYVTDSGSFAFILTLVEDDSGGVAGFGGISTPKNSPAFIVHGFARSSTVGLVLASIGGDSSIFQGRFTASDSLVGMFYEGQKRPAQPLRFARLYRAPLPTDSK